MAICAPIGRIMSVKKMSNYSAHNSNSVPTQSKQKDGEIANEESLWENARLGFHLFI
jgi:hypothetical protein